MTTIIFTQSTTVSGKIALTISSPDLSGAAFAFSVALTYSGQGVSFSNVVYSGTAATSVSAAYSGAIGSITLNGSFASSPAAPFATILFDAAGIGSFNADIVSMRVNGAAAVFSDPAAYGFSILGDAVSVQAGASALGTYMPLETFFPVTYAVKTAASHGNVSFGGADNPAAWKYAPDAGFYGIDFFTLKVSNGFDTKEKSLAISVSPVGTAGNDIFHSSAAIYHVDGGAGVDTLQYAGKSSDFVIAKSADGYIVSDRTGAEGVNYLNNFERLAFSDVTVSLDISGNGGQAYRIYQAAFNRTPDAAGLGYWINALDKGATLTEVAAAFMGSAEFINMIGIAPGNAQLVTKFYQNILHREPEKGGLDYWTGVLDTHVANQAAVLAYISESAENQAGLAPIIGNGFPYKPFLG